MLSHRTKPQDSLISRSEIPLPSTPVGLYIHVPFCRKACHYCDFYFSVRHSWMDIYAEALLNEIKTWSAWLMAQPVHTVYLGGGTPSWLKPPLLEKIFSALRQYTFWQPVEVTLEANPEDITEENLSFWQALGINRLSLGVQSLSAEVLRRLGRKADAAITRRALEKIANSGWTNWSVDVVFGVPGQNLNTMVEELRYLAAEVKVPHLSLYGLTIEPRTVLYKKHKRGQFEGVEDDEYAEIYLFIHDFLVDFGYDHYEVSNWGRDDFYGKHNLGYWEGKPYIGIGPSAHSYVWPYRWWNKADLRGYMVYFSECGEVPNMVEGEYIAQREFLLEWFMLRFRLSQEIKWAEVPLYPQFWPSLQRQAEIWAERGWVSIAPTGFRLLPLGWLWLNTILSEVLDLINHACQLESHR